MENDRVLIVVTKAGPPLSWCLSCCRSTASGWATWWARCSSASSARRSRPGPIRGDLPPTWPAPANHSSPHIQPGGRGGAGVLAGRGAAADGAPRQPPLRPLRLPPRAAGAGPVAAGGLGGAVRGRRHPRHRGHLRGQHLQLQRGSAHVAEAETILQSYVKETNKQMTIIAANK